MPPPTADRRGFSFRNAGRTFSFASKNNHPPPPASYKRPPTAQQQQPPLPPLQRDRAVTTSTIASASTATPPRLLDSDLPFDESEMGDFGNNMFDNIGSREGRDPSPMRSSPAQVRHFYLVYSCLCSLTFRNRHRLHLRLFSEARSICSSKGQPLHR